MRIALWSSRGAGAHYGGPGTSALRLYERAGNKTQVTLIHALKNQSLEDCFVDQIDCSSRFGLSTSTAKACSHIFKNSSKYDVLHALTAFLPSLAISATARKKNLPSVIKVAASQSELVERSGINPKYWAKKNLLGFPDAYFAISDDIDKELIKAGIPEERIARIPNGVNTNYFSVRSNIERSINRRNLGIHPDLPVLLFSGALVRRKRPHLLLQAASVLARSNAEFQLVFAGPALDITYRNELNRLAEELPKNIPHSFLGHRSDMDNIYGASDIFVLPSMREGMPNALLEAQACGLPAVVTLASGMSEIILPGHNGFIEQPDAQRLADRLMTLLKSPANYKEMSNFARARIVKQFDSEVVIDAHLKSFRSICRSEPVRQHGLF